MDSPTPSRYLVFITHGSTDSWVAEQIAQKVRDCGADAFLDLEKIGVGDDFEEQIVSNLNNASELLALLTPWSIKSLYVWTEIGASWARRIPLVIVLHGIGIEKIQSDPKIPVYIKRHNLIDINRLDKYLEQLKQRVGDTPTERLDVI